MTLQQTLPGPTAAEGLRERRPPRHAVTLLQAVAVTLMLFPSDAVLPAVGAAGFVAALVALAMALAYAFSASLGQHDPLRTHNPVRVGVAGLWVASLASYGRMQLTDVPVLAGTSADRWILLLIAMTAIIMVGADLLTTLDDVRRVVRALVWGGSACAFVAALQYWLAYDVSAYLRMVPGFATGEGYSAIMERGALRRVAGTALHPIELGVVAGMLLPPAVYLAVHDRERATWRRWLPVVLIGSAAATSVSRSAVLSLCVAVGTMVLFMPVRQRLVAFAALPFGLVAVFMGVPGLLRTLGGFFAAGSSDPSVATRVDDYPMVEALVRQAPLLGHGPATYLPDNALDILDNQYLKTVIEMGLVGVCALALYFAVPVAVAFAARARSRDPEVRALALSLASPLLAGAVCSVTFDSFSFPMFVFVHALLIGLVGACWTVSGHGGTAVPALVQRQPRSAPRHPTPGPPTRDRPSRRARRRAVRYQPRHLRSPV